MAHIHKLIDFTIVAIIVYKKKVLLVEHNELKRWLPIGGHIELNEDPDEALIREIKEECGLSVKVISPNKNPKLKDKYTKFLNSPFYLDIHKINKTHKHIGMVYFVKAKSANVKLKEDEHKNIRWFSKKDLDNPKYSVQPSIRFYSIEALRIIK